MGLCSKGPVGAPHSVMCLANNCAVGHTFGTMAQRFQKLFKRQVYVHHYARFMEADQMAAARDNVRDLQQAYLDVESMPVPEEDDLFEPEGMSFL